MKLVSVEGIVISTIPYKENSKIINILTKDMGIIGCISKGCKGLKSKLRLASEKYAYANFNISYKENGLSTLIEADIIDFLINIKSDIIKISYLSYICELSSKVYKECNNNEIYGLMIDAINKIEENYEPMIITNILELKYLNYIGINLDLDKCVSCGSNKIITISLQKGGYICNNCRTNEPLVDEKVIKLLRLYYYVDISKISNLDIDENVAKKINYIVSEYYDLYSGVVSKSKNFLKKLEEYK